MKNIKNMTLKEKLGQLIIAGFDGYTYNEHTRILIEEYQVGNIILFVRNVKDLPQLSLLNRTLHDKIMASTGVMPLITIDQEGGIVTRIMSGATFCPGNMTIAATKVENAEIIGEIMGEELSRLGINMNLAPALDVNNNTNNPVIGVRSYGDDPQAVSSLGTAFIKGLQSKGIIATAKHFPGHGDTSVDSHYGLPVVDSSKERLETVELYPFKQAIAAGVDAIMSAHIVFKAYEEKQLPATVSRNVMTGLLRKKLGFKGLIVSDCMEMKAIDDIFTTPLGVKLGIAAGLDMVFVSHSLDKQIAALRLLEEAVLNGEIPLTEIDEKVTRILAYKAKVYPTMKRCFYDDPNHLAYFNNANHKTIAQQIVDDSLTLIKGKRFLPYGKILVCATKPFATTIVEDKLDTRSIIDVINHEIPNIDTMQLPINRIDEAILEKISLYDQVVVCSYNAKSNPLQAQMINQIHALAKSLTVITVRNPYDYMAIPHVENVVTLYEYTPNAIRTIAKYLKGEINPKGSLPIQLQSHFPVGVSVYLGLKEYPLEDNITYLKRVMAQGIRRIFISAHMPEANEHFDDELNQIIAFAQENKLEIILDVSKKTFSRMKNIQGIYSLRLDWGFDVSDIPQMINSQYYIELNASVIRIEELKFLKNKGVDFSRLRISHNFYPKPYTGLDQKDVFEKNKVFKAMGLTIMAYVPSQYGKRPPLQEGLPTIEEHRHMDLVATLGEMHQLMVDEVCFGDAYCSEDELKTALEFNRDCLVIPCVVYQGISEIERDILMRPHRNRSDANPYFIRSSIREKRVIHEWNQQKRIYKTITIDNYKFLRYQGEVSIMKCNLPSDGRTNVVGYALISDYLLHSIKPNQKFRFEIRSEAPWKK